MKNILIKIFLILFMWPEISQCQLIYSGLAQHELPNASNPLIRLKQDTMYVPTKNGLFKKSALTNDTVWSAAGFQGMKINDYVFIGHDTIVCVADSSEGNTVFISTDNGNTYFNSTNGFGGTGIDFLPGVRIDVNPGNHQEIIAMSGACIARSADLGGSWTPVYLNWGYINYQSTILRYHPLNNANIYSGGELPLFASLFSYSFDGGINWDTSAVENNNAVNGVAFHPNSVDTILIGKEGKISRSPDKGVTWSDVYLTPNYEYIYAIVYDETNPNTLYAAGAVNGTNDTLRIFRSLDGGASWEDWKDFYLQNDGGGVISMVTYNNSLYILTRDHSSISHGVYKLDLLSQFMEEKYKNTTSIFPVPATDNLTIDINGWNKKGHLQIFNDAGILFKEIEISFPATINIQDLTEGNYFICLKNHGYQGLKFLKVSK